ncbi:PepSY-associated TM helix domain-containing protein [Agriterribacter sp.]|uniref:PepSY-associated TM helix domain-containing protein n=1 Tax=Agriterribacter sp. TaxID=2821509 RepID=UPI002D159B7A|nr:PepSY-associated TM helix domain-containing protein [Agriterribacter sp.]HRP54574.1 PepSY-associated TM helix domain-containing protein [Agriterribacter sp.]
MLKKLNAWLHLWLGLASGIVVLIVSVTGCILVFEQEIKSMVHPWLHAEKPAGAAYLPPSALYQSVAKGLPGKEAHSVWYHGSNRTAHLTLDGDSVVYMNPYTAEITAVVDHEDFFHIVEEGHRHLWLPVEVGRAIEGWGTLIFFVLLVTGVILWWPRRWNKKAVKQSFTIRWKARFKRVNYDLHNVLGFYALILSVIIAFTGLMMSFPWFNKTVFRLAGGEIKPRVQAVSDTSLAGNTVMLQQVDKAWQKGLQEIGQHNTDQVIVHFPDEPDEAIYVCVDMYRGSWRDVYLDQYSLAELPASAPRLEDTKGGAWLRRMNYGLHVGEVGDLTTKILYFLGSLICASLPVTGFMVWWGKKRKKTKKKLRPQRTVAYMPAYNE